MKDFESKRKWT